MPPLTDDQTVTDEKKKAQSHSLGPRAFAADTEAVKRANTPKTPEKEPDLKEIWGKMTTRQQREFLQRPDLTAKDLMYLDETLGIRKNPTGTTVSATPPLFSLAGLKEKARDLGMKVANQLPTAGGMLGGFAAQGGTVEAGPVSVAAEPVGSAFGGAVGEVGRQAITHALGQDDPDYTWSQRGKDVLSEAAGQGASELMFSKLAKAFKPTMSKSIDKLVSAGELGSQDTKGLESVMGDLVKAEKIPGNKVLTMKDFHDLLTTSKREIGNQVDIAMQQPVMRNGRQVPLRDAEATTNPIFNRIHDLLNAHPSEAPGAVGENRVKKKAIENRALQYAIPRKFGELTDRRIILNNNLAPLYELPVGERRAYLLAHPSLEIDKAEADAIRDVIYPEMDIASGHPVGTTEALQKKRGAIISLENTFEQQIGKLHAKTREIAGAPAWERGNISTYATSSGKPGFAFHRIAATVHTPNPEAQATAKVARAFGHKATSKAAKAAWSPAGKEILSMPIREWLQNSITPKPPEKDEDTQPDAAPGPSSSVKPYTHVFDASSGRILPA